MSPLLMSSPPTVPRTQAAGIQVRGAIATLPPGPPTLVVASGRGGSGSSLLATLLSAAAAGDGIRTLLIDADDLVSPLAMTLGITPRASWMDLRGGRVAPPAVVTPVSTTLSLVAGGQERLGGGSGAPCPAPERKACMRRLQMLAESADLVVIDAGSRLDAVLAAITPHAGERLLAVSSGSDPVGLASTYALCKAVHERHPALAVEVLVNRQDPREAARYHEAVDAGARQFLGWTLPLAGAIPDDPTLAATLRAGLPFLEAAAGSPAANAAHAVVRQVLDPRSSSPSAGS